MRPAGPDHALDLGEVGRFCRRHRRRRLGMTDLDALHQFGDGLTDRFPVRRVVVAGAGQRLAQRLQAAFVAQLRQAGTAQQRTQRGVAERGPIEFSEMGIAAGIVQQQGIADVIQRRPVLAGGQRAVGGAGEILKAHAVSFRRNREPRAVESTAGLQAIENDTNQREIQM